jgi:uncharacterized membrane protein HdeD (DUF308 family)
MMDPLAAKEEKHSTCRAWPRSAVSRTISDGIGIAVLFASSAEERAMQERDTRASGPGGLLGAPSELSSSQWWIVAFHGVLAIIFGIIFLSRPAASFRALLFVFGLWVLIDGFSALAAARRGGSEFLLEGLVGIVIGVALVWFLPRASGNMLYGLIAAWTILIGLSRIVHSTRLPATMRDESWLFLSGVISIVFGLLMVFMPHVAFPILALWIGLFAIITGCSLLGSSVRMRHLEKLGV